MNFEVRVTAFSSPLGDCEHGDSGPVGEREVGRLTQHVQSDLEFLKRVNGAMTGAGCDDVLCGARRTVDDPSDATGFRGLGGVNIERVEGSPAGGKELE